MAEDVDVDGPFQCWCGASGNYEEMFSAQTEDRCGGDGVLNCFCGGDGCVCHWHGSMECYGCEDCEPDEDDWGEIDEYE